MLWYIVGILLCKNEWDFSDEVLSINWSDEAAVV